MRRRRRGFAAAFCFIAVTAVVFFCIGIERELRPAAQLMAEYQARRTAEEAVNRGVHAVLEEFEEIPMVTVSRSREGEVQAVEVNVPAVNRFRLLASEQILRNLYQAAAEEIRVPVGTLMGSTLLTGRGPALCCRFLPLGDAEVRISSRFESCGINQTRHQLLLSVSVRSGAVLARGRAETEVPAEYVLAETVLVGTVPESYTSVITEDEELLGEVNDYRAE